MSKLAELLEKLPKEIRPAAQRYAWLWLDAADEQLDIFLRHVADGNIGAAYRLSLSRMTRDELREEAQRIDARLVALKSKKDQHEAAQREVIFDILMIGKALLLAKMIV